MADLAEIHRKKNIQAKTREVHQVKARQAEIEEKILQIQIDLNGYELQAQQIAETLTKVEKELKDLTQ